MIISMKKLEFLLYHKERDHFLESLRALGVFHCIESESVAAADEILHLETLVKRYESTIKKLRKIKNIYSVSQNNDKSYIAIERLEQYEKLESEHEKILLEIQTLKKERELLEPWGQFDTGIMKQLNNAGVNISLYTTPVKKFKKLQIDDNTIIIPLKELAGIVYFCAISYNNDFVINADEFKIPEKSYKETCQALKNCESKLVACLQSMQSVTPHISLFENSKNGIEDQLRYKRAHMSMSDHSNGKILHLSGWFPAEHEKKIQQLLEMYCAWYSITEPSQDDCVPVKLKNSQFSKLFEPITGLYSLPHHTELDITPFMAPFFSIFFGLCLGDIGYGLLLLTAALLLYKKSSITFKPFTLLGIVLSVSTILSGVLLNSFFGQPVFGGKGVENAFISSGVEVFSPLASTAGENGTMFPAMGLALVLGVFQILFGMVLQAYIRAKNYGITAGIQPVASMVMLIGGIIWAAHINLLNLKIGEFIVGPVKVGAILLNVPFLIAKISTLGGLLAFLLFNNIDKKMFIRPATGIWEFYQFATGILGDVLSYLRLFALGLAGGLLGSAFNQIAFMVITTDGVINYKSPAIIATILILITGHSLNLCLSLIGSFVHPLRLTFVEFYKNIGFKGGGKPFVPLVNTEIDQIGRIT